MIGVDEAGYIKQMPTVPLSLPYRTLLVEVCERLWDALPTLMHSVYVYGSVARGTARLGVSDLDLTIILWQAPNQKEREHLRLLQTALGHAHPQVSKVDFDLGTVAEVLAPASALRWGGWLKHYCRHVKGTDLSMRFPALKPSHAFALALNGDCLMTLKSYASRLETAVTDAEAGRLQKEAARQLLRATMVLRSDQDEGWPISLADMVALAIRHHPEQADTWAYFERQAQPSQRRQSDKTVFLARLRAYIFWLDERLKDEEPY